MRLVRQTIVSALLIVTVTAVAPAARAGDEAAAAPAPAMSLRASAIAAARLSAGAGGQEPGQEPDAAGQAPDEPRAFFKSPRGLAVLAGLIGTAAYVLYSKSHDRVRSPIS